MLLRPYRLRNSPFTACCTVKCTKFRKPQPLKLHFQNPEPSDLNPPAGTSVGGLLAVMLLTPNEDGRPLFSAAEAATFIKNNSPMIFYKHWAAGLRQIFKPKYSTK